MKTIFATASALALVVPAFAQTATPPATTEATPMTEATTATTTTTTTPTADGATTTESTTVAQTTATGPEGVIATEFPTYDKDSSGELSKAEFTTWLTALKSKSNEPAMKPAELKSWTSTSFVKADSDKNKAVSQAELTTYLTAGA